MREILNHKIIGQGQPLIILHGLFGSLDNWFTLGKKFGEEFQVILVDQRNHGRSFHSSEFNYSEMADDLDHLIDHLKIENPILLGHSMGGKTVMQYAAYHATNIAGLIVADIGPKKYPVHHQLILDALNAVNFENITSRADVEKALSQYIDDIGVRTFLMKNLSRNESGQFKWKMNLKDIGMNIIEVGAELDYYLPVEVPSLFIYGGNSNYILEEDKSEILDIFPETTFEKLPKAGHWLHAEDPDGFYSKVQPFLQNIN